MALALRYEACVRTRSVEAGCRACVDTCPTKAVVLEGDRRSVAVELARCIECGLCEAACPTEAFSGTFDVTAFVARAGPAVRCGEDGLACVGALAAEDLVVLAQRHGTLKVEAKACAAADPGHARAEDRAGQARLWLETIGSKAKVEWVGAAPAAVRDSPSPAPSGHPLPGGEGTGGAPPSEGRRALLRLFVPMAASKETPGRISQPARLDRDALRTPRLTERRKRFLAALPDGAQAKHGSVPSGEIGFTSSKKLDVAACTGCMLCVNLCPTGALSTPRLPDQLRFDASRCVKCHLCHDVCEPDAIRFAPRLETGDVLELAPKVLGHLPLRSCGECGALFKIDGDSPICPTCRGLDEEARELTGVKR